MTQDPTQDDAYASLFRPEPVTPEHAGAPAAADPVAPADPAPPARHASTGRLFRSTASPTDTDAIPALRSDQARGLRTVGAAAAAAAPVVITTTAGASSTTPTITPEPMSMQEPPASRERARRVSRAADRTMAAAPGLGPGLVLLVVILVTIVAGLIDVLIGAGLGWIWGAGMLVSSAYGAFAVRRGDGTYAVTAPAIAALASVLTVAQMNLGASGGSLFDRAVVAFFALGDHWTWIVGSTVLALVIVAIRARTRRD